MEWWSVEKEKVLEILNVDPRRGLTEEEAKKRLEEFGENKIEREKRKSPIIIFLSQFTSPLVLILFFASILSFFLGEHTDTILILLIILINGILGFHQEFKAERAIEELAKLATPRVVVLREGKRKIIYSNLLVPGDIVILRQGDIVPADLRVIEAEGVETDESILTGEAKPIEKEDCVLDEKTPIYKRKNMLFMGTVVLRGNCTGVVVETGKKTELGKIAEKLQKIEEKKTAMMIEIERLAGMLTKMTLLIIGALLFLGVLLKIADLKTVILVAVSLGVAAIPEGLPIVMTISMALGAQRMLKRNVLIRRLRAIKDLGSVDVICTDKTGTLTEGRMKPKIIWIWDRFYFAETISILEPSIERIISISLYCHDLREVEGKLVGDEVELALHSFGYRYKDVIPKKKVKKKIPFDPKRKMMSVILEDNTILTKGAPEKVLEKCKYIYINGKIEELDERKAEIIRRKYRELAGEGYYVLGFAYGVGEKEENLVFLGIVGLFDKIRERVREAIAECKKAGIRVIMVTGDNKYTATKVAKEIGIDVDKVLEGEEISKLSDEELRRVVEEVNVFARVSPEDKYRILLALQKNGHSVGMTGDGVNDALALKKADAGIAMGIRGAEVSKQVADVVILDDNFATIVDGIKEGRAIIENIYKFVNYLVSSNIMEVIVVFLASLFKRIILTPVQLLWINLATDGPLATSLSFDPVPEGIMERSPRRKVVDNEMIKFITIFGSFSSVIVLLFFFLSTKLWGDKIASTIAFTSIIFIEFSKLFVVKKIKEEKIFSNRVINISLLVLIIMQLLMIYTPLSKYFKIGRLYVIHWIPILLSPLFVYLFGVTVGKAIFSQKLS